MALDKIENEGIAESVEGLDLQDQLSSSEQVLFQHKDQALRLISAIVSSESGHDERIRALEELRTTLDRYLECPILIDPHLESLLVDSQLTSSAQSKIQANFFCKGATPNSEDEAVFACSLSVLYSFSKVCGRKKIQRFLPHDAHDVEPVLYALQRQRQIQQAEEPNQSLHQGNVPGLSMPPLWERTYVLLLWMEMLSFVPFDLNTIDSHSHQTSDTKNLAESIIATTKLHLSDVGSTREVAANCLASFLIRFDLSSDELTEFVSSSREVILAVVDNEHSMDTTFRVMGILHTLAAIFKLAPNRSHLLSCIDILWEPILRFSVTSICLHNTLLRKLVVKLFARVGCAYLPPRVAPWRYQRGGRGMNLLDNLKQSQQLNSLREAQANDNPNELANSQIGEEILLSMDLLSPLEDILDQLLKGLRDSATIVRWSAAKGIGRVTERLPLLCAESILDAVLECCSDSNKNQDSAWHGACLALAELARRGLLLPERLNTVVPRLQLAMQYDLRRGQHSVGSHVRDAACYVCWAFARAYDPVLLKKCLVSSSDTGVDELSVTMVIASLFDREINCRRAASAAFQEWVGRQGAQYVKHGIDILTVADYFTLGNRVDAFTRIAPMVARFDGYGIPIINHLVDFKLIHWDPDIRLLSSKSLYFLAKIPDFQEYFISDILDELIPKCFASDLYVRHGSVLGVSEIVLALGARLKTQHLSSIESQIIEINPTIEKKRLYRGRGGEIMRSAVMRLIECISLAELSLTVKHQVAYLDSVDASLKHPNEEIQQSSGAALYALMRSYFPVTDKGPTDRLQKRVVDLYVSTVLTSDNAAATRGFALGLGKLPDKLLAPSADVLKNVLNCLCTVSHPCRKVGDEHDAETRRNAITALGAICKTVGVQNPNANHNTKPYPRTGLDQNDIRALFETFLLSLEDYGVDRRGDVGSWVRCEAMKCLQQLVFLTVQSSTAIPSACPLSISKQNESIIVPSFESRAESFVHDCVKQVGLSVMENRPFRPERSSIDFFVFDDHICTLVLGALLKQIAEKIDSVRLVAGTCIESILLSRSPTVPFIPQRSDLLEALGLESVVANHSTKISTHNYSSPAIAYPIVMRAAVISSFFQPIIAGMVLSVGGLSESTVKHAQSSLLSFLRAAELSNPAQISNVADGEWGDNMS